MSEKNQDTGRKTETSYSQAYVTRYLTSAWAGWGWGGRGRSGCLGRGVDAKTDRAPWTRT